MQELREENRRLHARIAALEAERAYERERLSRLLAETQERAYWFDRTGVDMDRVLGSAWGSAAFRIAQRLRRRRRAPS